MARERLFEEDGIEVRAKVPKSISANIDALAALSGSSKATIMRQIVLMGLVSYEMVSAEATIAAVTTYANTKKTDTKERS